MDTSFCYYPLSAPHFTSAW